MDKRGSEEEGERNREEGRMGGRKIVDKRERRIGQKELRKEGQEGK